MTASEGKQPFGMGEIREFEVRLWPRAIMRWEMKTPPRGRVLIIIGSYSPIDPRHRSRQAGPSQPASSYA